MTAAFRLVHFAPNPQRGDRFTVGGLLRDTQGTRAFVSPQLPGLSVLGNVSWQRLLTRSLVHLEAHTDFQQLAGFGPYFFLGKEQVISQGEGDQLVQQILASASPPAAGDSEHKRPRERQEKGWRWVQHHRLDDTINRLFQAGFGDGAFLAANPALDRVSQYVKGSHGFMLLEPLVMRAQLRDDIRKVTQRLTTYRDVFSLAGQAQAEVRVYGVDLDQDARREACAALDSVEIEFVDAKNSVAKKAFIKRVRDFSEAPLLRS